MKKNVFLLEIILAIMMFAISSAVCLRIFVHSRLLAEESKEMNMAVLAAATIEETFMSSSSVDEAMDVLSKTYVGFREEEGGGRITLDEPEEHLSESADSTVSAGDVVAKFNIAQGNSGTTKISIEVSNSKKRLYGADVEVYYEK